jgi:F0F1-type ATP synthase epsilon subunit
MADDFLRVMVFSRDKIVYQGKAKTLTGINASGTFDVLKEHANFISVIFKQILVRQTDGQTVQIPLEQGIMRVADDEVKVYLGFGTQL